MADTPDIQNIIRYMVYSPEEGRWKETVFPQEVGLIDVTRSFVVNHNGLMLQTAPIPVGLPPPPSFGRLAANALSPLLGKQLEDAGVKKDGPFVGYKTIHLLPDNGRLRIKGAESVYDVDAVAVCNKNLPHLAPHPNCQCGFWAYKQKESSNPNYTVDGRGYVAEVQLFGRVIEAELGFRAERQRVTRITASPLCYQCDQQAIGFVCGTGAIPSCADHAPFGVLTTQQVSAAIGVPVEFAVPPSEKDDESA